MPGVLGTPLRTLLTESRFGALWLARGVLIVALALLVWSLARGERLVTPRPRGAAGVLWAFAALTSGLLLLTTSLGSHAAASGSRFPPGGSARLAAPRGSRRLARRVACIVVVLPQVAAALADRDPEIAATLPAGYCRVSLA